MQPSIYSVGMAMPYTYPKTLGFFTANRTEDVNEHIEENGIYYVTEKLDGCNIAISSEGFISSRNKIIATRESELVNFQGLPLTKVQGLFDNVTDLHEYLTTVFKFAQFKFELIVFGEFMPNGTANSKYDLYNYAERGYEKGQMYAFAIGLLFHRDENCPSIFMKQHFKSAFLHTLVNDKKMVMVPINWFLSKCFYKYKIPCVQVLAEETLENVFLKPKYMKNLMDRKVEGYILAHKNGNKMLKLKYSKTHHSLEQDVFNELKEGLIFQKLWELHYNLDNYKNELNKPLFSKFLLNIKDDNIIKLYDKTVDFSNSKLGSNLEREIDYLTLVAQKEMEDVEKKRLDPEVRCMIKQKITTEINHIIRHHLYCKK